MTDPSSKLVYDVGMFDGSDTARYLAMGFRVVAVEANPHYVEQAKQRFKSEISAGRLVVESAGVGKEPGSSPFYVVEKMPHKSTFVESFARQVGGSDIREMAVETLPLRTLFERHGRGHYVKIDIEESDELCIDDLAGEMMPDYASAEMGRNIGILDKLHEVGFRDFKCVSQFSYLPLPVHELPGGRNKQMLQSVLESTSLPVRAVRKLGLRELIMRYLHPSRDDISKFTSGDFGEMTGGRWRSLGEMTEYYESYMASNHNGSTWVDAHVRAPRMSE